MTPRSPFRTARALPAGMLAVMLLSGTALAQVAAPVATPVSTSLSSTLATALQERVQDRRVTRQISLADMGMDAPVVFQGMDMRREIYLPVPAGVPIHDASIQVSGEYMRADGGRTTAVFSIDGDPQVARNLEGDKGVVDLSLPVKGNPRPSGFVRFGVTWASVIGEDLCGDERAIGNVLKLDPSSRFTYSYDAAQVRDIATAWSTLTGHGSLLLPGGTLSKATYDTAWRLGLSLELAGKQVRVKTLPQVGDTVDLTGLDVPFGLRAVAPFSNLASGGNAYRIQEPAEIGALLLLPGSPFGADMTVADPALMGQIRAGLDALTAKLGDGSGALVNEWRAKAASLGAATISEDELSLQTLAGRPIIAVGANAGNKASALFDSFWRGALSGSNVVVRAVDTTPTPRTRVPLSDFGVVGGNLDVLARGEWVLNFDLASATTGGKVPSRLNMDLAAAPGASNSAPVVSVFLNDVLLSARKMDANGQPEQLSASIPPYALGARNTLRVNFQRQPVSDRCRETPQAFPAAVLPTSNMDLGGTISGSDFLGAISGMVNNPSLVVPDSYLSNPTASLVRVVRAAAASGLPVATSTLAVSPAGTPYSPSGAFLAMDVPVDVALKARVEGDRLIVGTDDKSKLIDIAGLRNLALVQAVTKGDTHGIIWQSVGAPPLTPSAPVRLSRGDVAVVGPTGTLFEFFANGAEVAEARVGDAESVSTTMQRLWQNSSGWGLPLGVGLAVLFFLLLVRASYVRRRGN